MTDKIAELRELEKAATPGPWHVWEHTYLDVHNIRHHRNQDGHNLAGVVAPDQIPEWNDKVPIFEEDAALIVAMRNALPALLDVVEAARRIDRLISQWNEQHANDEPDGTLVAQMYYALHPPGKTPPLDALDGAE